MLLKLLKRLLVHGSRRSFRIDECVPEHKLLAFEIFVFSRQFTPFLGETYMLCVHSLFKRAKLLNEAYSDLKVLSPSVEKL
jgi:hypothetical protein